MKKKYILGFVVFILGCQNANHQSLDRKITVNPSLKLSYSIIGSEEKPALAVTGNLISSVSLKEVLIKEQFDFARIECDKLNEFKPYAYLKVKDEKRKTNTFQSDFLLKICPEDDANSEHCVKNIEDFRNRIKTNLSCEVVFGGMTKSKIIISNRFKINKNQILNAEEYALE